MNLRRVTAAALLSLALPVTGWAQGQTEIPQTSGELRDQLESCEGDSCMSYVTGAIHGIAVWSIFANKPQPFCAGENVSGNDIRKAIISVVDTTPDLAEQHPVLSVLTAFARNWPCMTADQVATLASARIGNVPDIASELLAEGKGRALVLGDALAGPDKTIRIFYDPNCPHCHEFRDTADELANRGWRVEIFPVAAVSEASAGFGAMALALRDVAPAAAEALYRHDGTGDADILAASDLAASAGLSQADILTAVARSGAYGVIEDNTRLLYSLGASGTPSWTIGRGIYAGKVSADAVELLARHDEELSAAPSPAEQNAPRAEEH